MIQNLLIIIDIVFGTPSAALDLETPFQSIDGGTLSISEWSGQPVLVVNTASMCAFSS
jgi:glutathione peroxidase